MAGECQTKNKGNYDENEKEKPIVALDEGILYSRLTTFLYSCIRNKLICW
jgi:hypothetical protein